MDKPEIQPNESLATFIQEVEVLQHELQHDHHIVKSRFFRFFVARTHANLRSNSQRKMNIILFSQLYGLWEYLGTDTMTMLAQQPGFLDLGRMEKN